VRRGEAVSHLVEPMFSLGRLLYVFSRQEMFSLIETLRVANADAQHHDAVTGTSVPHVVEMYKDDLIIGMNNTGTVSLLT